MQYSSRTADTPPTVAIVIPAYNEAAVIERCLRAALDQTRQAHEILVVDNRSTDATADIAREVASAHPEAPIRVLSQDDAQGLVPTRNRGFAAASADILGRIDADAVIDREWVARVSTVMREGEVGAVSGPVSYYDLPFAGGERVSDDLARRALRRLNPEYPFLFGSNMAIRASAWRAIERDACLDRADVLHEDIDLSVHLHDAGIRVAYEPAMRATVSARRLSTSPKSFRAYTDRFERTYAAHQIHRWQLAAPRLLLQGAYWWSRVLRRIVPASPAPVPA